MSTKKTDLRVGIFVAVAIAIGGAFIFALGSQSSLFSRKTTYHAVFDDVGGLRPGNAVRIAGVSVGTVDEVVFLDDGRVDVTFAVVNSAASLIRERTTADADADADEHEGNEHGDEEGTGDSEEEEILGSEVMLGSKGMLGDRLIDIRPGHQSLPEWQAEDALPVSGSADLMALAENVAGKVDDAISNVQEVSETLGDPQFNSDLREVVSNLAQFTGMLASGDGAVQRLMTNPETADRLDATLTNIQHTSAEFRRTASAFRGVAEEVRSGDGSAHALIYGDEGRVALDNIGRASGEVATLLSDVRTGDGTVHDLIYEGSGDALISNLTEMSGDLAAITGDMRAGRGTIGGLLVDPSIYEDVKRLVGDLQRNDILRSLVRYSIRRDASVEDTPVEAVE